jgi:hypothetical protein
MNPINEENDDERTEIVRDLTGHYISPARNRLYLQHHKEPASIFQWCPSRIAAYFDFESQMFSSLLEYAGL